MNSTFSNYPHGYKIEKTEAFNKPEALAINNARMEHLGSLGLDLNNKTVLDVGCGIGHLAQFFIKRGCDVFCVDGREGNILELQSRYPNLKYAVADIEKEDLSKFGLFDIVFCYGLLYHCSNPEAVLKNISSACRNLLLLETCITDYPEPVLRLAQETPSFSQALHGIGSRPSPSYVIWALRRAGFSYIYFPKTIPDYRDFNFSFKGNFSYLRNGHPMRQIFIASKPELSHPSLFLVHGNEEHLFARKKKIVYRIRDLVLFVLAKLPENFLVRLARVVYRPRPLELVPYWYVGATEVNLSIYRIFLKLIWFVLIFKENKKNIIINWHNNIRMILRSKNELDRCIYIEGCYEPGQFYFLNQVLKEGMVFVDAGANTGLYSLFASKMVGSNGLVLAIEPSQREVSRLEKHFLLNSVYNARVKKIALSNRTTQCELLIADTGHEGHNTLGDFGYQETILKKKEKVLTDTLDNILENESIEKVDVMKMDIEGSEFLALQGARKTITSSRPIILIELSDRLLKKQNCNSRQVLGFLREFSYVVYYFNKITGKPVLLTKAENYYDSENMIALPREKVHVMQQYDN